MHIGTVVRSRCFKLVGGVIVDREFEITINLHENYS